MRNNSSPGQAVHEPFAGSGTTLIAVEMEGRACHAIELSPGYVDVAVLRWQASTGQQAMLEPTGRAFVAAAVDRSGGSPMTRRYDPSAEDPRTVRALSGYGVPPEDIAIHIDIDAKTLRKHFRRELDRGERQGRADPVHDGDRR